jgi:hypothetical protein
LVVRKERKKKTTMSVREILNNSKKKKRKEKASHVPTRNLVRRRHLAVRRLEPVPRGVRVVRHKRLLGAGLGAAGSREGKKSAAVSGKWKQTTPKHTSTS